MWMWGLHLASCCGIWMSPHIKQSPFQLKFPHRSKFIMCIWPISLVGGSRTMYAVTYPSIYSMILVVGRGETTFPFTGSVVLCLSQFQAHKVTKLCFYLHTSTRPVLAALILLIPGFPALWSMWVRGFHKQGHPYMQKKTVCLTLFSTIFQTYQLLIVNHRV